MSRRTAVKAGASLMLASTLPPTLGAIGSGAAAATGASRASLLRSRTRLVHADLHNHTLMSDGDGDPAAAFTSMRAAGLDVAALTDHATISNHLLGDVLAGLLPPEYKQAAGLTPQDWARTGRLADAANRDGRFTAIRGFEWSEPLIGHVNVWFTENYVDVLQAGVMQPLLNWLARGPGLVLGGGADGIAGFNHPGREPGRFQEFHYDPRLRSRVVSLEMFNRRDDYLFEGWADGKSSPLVACLNAGWRTGLTGVTDEHGTDWGFPEGKGRTGLWVTEHSRAGVKQAMLGRRFFATRTSGLRVEATLTSGERTKRMGQVVRHRKGPVTIELDIARDKSWVGRPLQVQVLRPGPKAPNVSRVIDIKVGGVHKFRVPVDVENGGDWLVLRIADPREPNATPGPAGHPGNKLGIAYTSPWWFDPS